MYKMPNWFSRLDRNNSKSRYTFSAYGDIFVPEDEDKEQEKQNAEENLIRKLSNGDGIRVNNYEIEPYKSVF